jgi:hypothetical protein
MASKSNVSNAGPATGGTAGSDTTPTRTGSLSQKDIAARRKQVSQDWNDFQDILQRVSKHAREYSDMDRIIKENSTMQSELAEKTVELLEKDKRISFIETQMLNSFEARYKKWDNETADLKRQLERGKSQAERKVQSMEAKLTSLQGNVDSLDTRLAQATEEADFARKECDINKHRLQEWDNYLSQLKDMDLNDLGVNLDQFFKRCFNVMSTTFSIDLPSRVLKDITSWEKLVKKLHIKLGFPPTNSPVAKLMRVAAALHIFAVQLLTDIFRPWYVPESVKDSWATKNILNRHFGASSRKGDIVRALLLSNRQTEEENNAVANVAKRASEDVHEQLRLFLSDDGSEFQARLEELFQEAANLWLEMQHSKKEIEAHIEEPLEYENDWAYLEAFGKITQQQQMPQSEALYLFPRLHVSGDETVVHQGYVLWHDQAAVISAQQEVSECRKRNRRGTSGSSVSGSARRDSMVIGVENGNVQSPQASPTIRRKDMLGGGAALPSHESSSQI